MLGEDGSGQTAAVAPGHEVLQELDGLLSSYGKGFAESSSAVDLNLKACQRSPGLLHLAGAVDELPALSEASFVGCFSWIRSTLAGFARVRSTQKASTEPG